MLIKQCESSAFVKNIIDSFENYSNNIKFKSSNYCFYQRANLRNYILQPLSSFLNFPIRNDKLTYYPKITEMRQETAP